MMDHNEIAELIYFLTSLFFNKSKSKFFITGGFYLIDGGLTAKIPH